MTHYNSFDITSVLTVSKHTESTRGLRDVLDAFGGKFSQRHLICMDVHLLAKNLSLQLEPNTDCCLIIIIISLLSLEVQLFLVFQFDIFNSYCSISQQDEHKCWDGRERGKGAVMIKEGALSRAITHSVCYKLLNRRLSLTLYCMTNRLYDYCELYILSFLLKCHHVRTERSC